MSARRSKHCARSLRHCSQSSRRMGKAQRRRQRPLSSRVQPVTSQPPPPLACPPLPPLPIPALPIPPPHLQPTSSACSHPGPCLCCRRALLAKQEAQAKNDLILLRHKILLETSEQRGAEQHREREVPAPPRALDRSSPATSGTPHRMHAPSSAAVAAAAAATAAAAMRTPASSSGVHASASSGVHACGPQDRMLSCASDSELCSCDGGSMPALAALSAVHASSPAGSRSGTHTLGEEGVHALGGDGLSNGGLSPGRCSWLGGDSWKSASVLRAHQLRGPHARRRPPPRAPLPLPLTISQRMAQRVDLRVAQQATTHLTRHRRAPRRRSGPPTL